MNGKAAFKPNFKSEDDETLKFFELRATNI